MGIGRVIRAAAADLLGVPTDVRNAEALQEYRDAQGERKEKRETTEEGTKLTFKSTRAPKG